MEGDQNIGGLEVAVNDSFSLRVLHRLDSEPASGRGGVALMMWEHLQERCAQGVVMGVAHNDLSIGHSDGAGEPSNNFEIRGGYDPPEFSPSPDGDDGGQIAGGSMVEEQTPVVGNLLQYRLRLRICDGINVSA